MGAWSAEALELGEALVRNEFNARVVMQVLNNRITDRSEPFTRNAVIGKKHRLRWDEGLEDKKLKREMPTHTEINRMVALLKEGKLLNGSNAVLEPKPKSTPPEPVKIVPLSAEIQRWMCRWPEEPGRDGLGVCGKTAQPGRHLCAEHLTEDYRRQHKPATAQTGSHENQEQQESVA